MTFLRLALLKSPAMIEAASGLFVDVAAELLVEFGQSQARVCLRWNVNGSSDDRGELAGVNRMGGR